MALWILLALNVGLAIGAAILAPLIGDRIRRTRQWQSAVERLRAVRARQRSAAAAFATGGIVLAIGVALIALVGYVAGEALAALEAAIDVPVVDWMTPRIAANEAMADLSRLLTQIGDPIPIQFTSVGLAIVLGIAYGRHFWVPPVFVVGGYVIERYLQSHLAAWVDRGAPNDTAGTYFSGGMARLIVVWGIALVLADRRFVWARRLRPFAVGLLVVAAVIEGFTRTVLIKHWITDVIGGALVGGMLLGLLVVVLNVIGAEHTGRRVTSAAHRR